MTPRSGATAKRNFDWREVAKAAALVSALAGAAANTIQGQDLQGQVSAQEGSSLATQASVAKLEAKVTALTMLVKELQSRPAPSSGPKGAAAGALVPPDRPGPLVRAVQLSGAIYRATLGQVFRVLSG